jgi:hypothetical protein
VIARIVNFDQTGPVAPASIQNWVRRPLTTYVTTKIDGISWVHGATYSKDELDNLIPHHAQTGLVVHFTRPIHRETVTKGVVDLWRIEGGLGSHADIEAMDFEITALPANSPMVDRLVLRNTTDETLDYGDRLLIQIRTNFLLDACCRAVDGEHIGGRTPLLLPEFEDVNRRQLEEAKNRIKNCVHQPFPRGPWQSGNQLHGGDFVSWIYCEERQHTQSRRY